MTDAAQQPEPGEFKPTPIGWRARAMTPYHQDQHLTVWQGDCREVMAAMPAESVDCVVTSPPYWGLRDYGTATWLGGLDDCDHVDPGVVSPKLGSRSTLHGGIENILRAQTAGARAGSTCRKCGAIRQDSQLGLEPTPEEYVENMVAVFREVRRVLRADGTCWVNLGDSYISGQGGRQTAAGSCRGTVRQDRPTPKARPELENAPSGWAERAVAPRTYPGAGNAYGWKPKDLAGIPWRVAFALQADGWYLRSDIIWSKPNPMPESVTDRPTKAHEYLFLLSKSPRYYYDADAVREAAEYGRREQPASTWDRLGTGTKDAVRVAGSTSGSDPSTGRNLRTVWTIATQPYPGAHFATFPEKLVEPCVKAGCPPDGVVLDPFAGSGTTGRVAQRLGRRAVLIDLSGDYLMQAMARNADMPLGLIG